MKRYILTVNVTVAQHHYEDLNLDRSALLELVYLGQSDHHLRETEQFAIMSHGQGSGTL